MKTETKTLQLMLRHKWFDMISSGEKKEEYRELKPYWLKRIFKPLGDKNNNGTDETSSPKYEVRDFSEVCFHLGYTNKTVSFKIDGITIGMGRKEWGAVPNKQYIVIKLGSRV